MGILSCLLEAGGSVAQLVGDTEFSASYILTFDHFDVCKNTLNMVQNMMSNILKQYASTSGCQHYKKIMPRIIFYTSSSSDNSAAEMLHIDDANSVFVEVRPT